MGSLKYLLILAAAWGAYQAWGKYQAEQRAEQLMAASEHGFVAIPSPAGMNAEQVIVFAPLNCPSQEAQRADELARQLENRGVPVARVKDARFDFVAPDQAGMAVLNQVMTGTLPVVFVAGKAKGNPTLDEVLAEYRGAQ